MITFRFSYQSTFITLHLITFDYGEVTRTKRILGPVADEVSSYYENHRLGGIVVTNHPAILLNNKRSTNR
jgi:hypothetical protein